MCVELDGYSHGAADRPERDAARDRWLASQGIETLRLRAGLVLEDLDAALGMVRTAARTRLGKVDCPPPIPPPSSRGQPPLRKP
ncbi:MAG: DUF559 domain-containing protein, partial [Phenylobacterium sp.]|nr:DUF559 domain-containing protein [Phenylobacterium sp.]